MIMNLKKSMLCAFFMTFLMMSIITPVVAAKPVKDDGLPAGNHVPSGQHFNLNIIGVPNEKNVNFEGGQGSRIFILRTGTTRFYVHGGTSYQVLDHDGTDGLIGEDRLNPGIIFPYNAALTPAWRVQIYVRLLGPKDSSIRWKSSYFDGTEYVLFADFTMNRDQPSKFSLKTGQLLADGYQDILWELSQKTNFRILQLRIYLMDA